MIIPFVSFLSLFCYLAWFSPTRPLSLTHLPFLLTAGLLHPFSRLLVGPIFFPPFLCAHIAVWSFQMPTHQCYI